MPGSETVGVTGHHFGSLRKDLLCRTIWFIDDTHTKPLRPGEVVIVTGRIVLSACEGCKGEDSIQRTKGMLQEGQEQRFSTIGVACEQTSLHAWS